MKWPISRALGEVIDERADLSYQDVQQVTTEVVKAEQPTMERIKGFIGRIAVSGLSGALSSGVTTGLGEALAHIHL
jgi:citrate lyase alpha subunit